MLDFQFLKQSFTNHTFFKDKTWQLSPTPLELPIDLTYQLTNIGEACFEFLLAINKLYFASKANKSILRNKNFIVPWVSQYFDRGKPPNLLTHANLEFIKHLTPQIIRLDLILTKENVALTEIEVIPGGIGFTAFLHQLYEKQNSLIGSSQNMLLGFYESMSSLTPHKENPIIVLAVSDESETYRPEFEWLAAELRKSGKQVYCLNPKLLYSENSKLKFKFDTTPLDVDVIYRFFELFDLESIPISSILINAVEKNEVIISPPLKPIFEEKLCLALFHHYQLQDFWQENLKPESFELLKTIIPPTWIIDGEPFGPNAILNGPKINDQFLHSWEQLGETTQKNRNYIIKISGFHEKAWGARSITLGTDSSQAIWASKIKEALENAHKHPFVIQKFKKPKRILHPFFDQSGELTDQPSRVRLCPYYMKKNSKISLNGILATLCPADKKIIHGMSVATFIPCTTSTTKTK